MAERSYNYELAFHVDPNLEEAKIFAIREEFENLITKNGGIITYAKDLERTRLSYPINHSAASYFGYLHFKSENPEALLTILQEHIKLEANIIRSLILKLPSDEEKNRAMMSQLKRQERMKKAPVQAPITPQDAEKMEEQIEDVIEKL